MFLFDLEFAKEVTTISTSYCVFIGACACTAEVEFYYVRESCCCAVFRSGWFC